MKRKSFSRRAWIALGVPSVALATAVCGHAFFSTTGNGTGSGSGTVNSSDLTHNTQYTTQAAQTDGEGTASNQPTTTLTGA